MSKGSTCNWFNLVLTIFLPNDLLCLDPFLQSPLPWHPQPEPTTITTSSTVKILLLFDIMGFHLFVMIIIITEQNKTHPTPDELHQKRPPNTRYQPRQWAYFAI